MEMTPTRDQVSALTQFLRLLEKWNHAFNLTAIRDPDEMVALHVLDSLSARPLLDGVSILDAGTGAGLPGIPLAILEPERHFLLLDSGGKKTRFVRHVVGELAIENVTVVQARVEDYEPTVLFDTVICRAFSSVGQFVRGCGRFIAPGGRLIAMKGRVPDDEFSGLPGGWEVTEVSGAGIPGLAVERHIVVIQRIAGGRPAEKLM
jgi:16S rRNA (guanine527-N7)-methyltransferase